jgi:hypothetical protein
MRRFWAFAALEITRAHRPKAGQHEHIAVDPAGNELRAQRWYGQDWLGFWAHGLLAEFSAQQILLSGYLRFVSD